jgi:Zn-dependent peptidase ImmA (M78 family)
MSRLLSEESASLCEDIAEETRAELELGAQDPVEAERLARLLEIEVVLLGDYRDKCPDEVVQLCEEDPTALSAVTFFRGTQCMVIVNPRHPRHSKEESVLHELAHVLLEHEPKQLFNDHGLRIWHDCDEAQADYLTCALTVPSAELARMAAVLEGDVVSLAAHFDVDLAIVAERAERLSPVPAELFDEAPAASTLSRLRPRLPTSADGQSAPATSPAA